MFGVIISGRPVVTDSTTISPTQVAFAIPAQPKFSHIVVFFLPGTELPAEHAAAVHVQLTPGTPFRLLGAIANEKQSAIFRIRTADHGSAAGDSRSLDADAMVDEALQTTANNAQEAHGNIVLGISVEPTIQINQTLALQKDTTDLSTAGTGTSNGTATTRQSVSTKILAQRIIANAYNFLASFSAGGNPSNEVVPLKSFQDWWKKFEKKVELDPSFLERDDSS